jgi:hypothetical protein
VGGFIFALKSPIKPLAGEFGGVADTFGLKIGYYPLLNLKIFGYNFFRLSGEV